MLVYTSVVGESPPEGMLLDVEDPTVEDLLVRVRSARSAMNREVTLAVDNATPTSSLRELGVSDGDLVLVEAHGEPKPEIWSSEEHRDGEARPELSDQVSSPQRRGRRLTEYEEVTQLLQWHAPYHTDGGFRPLYQVWADENSALQCSDWDAYRAPDALYYRTYVAMQAAAEQAIQAAFDFAADSRQLTTVDPGRLEILRQFLGALHYPEWGLCVNYQHATRFAMSSWIAGAAEFMMFDAFRHAQLFGRLCIAFGELHDGFDEGSALWLNDSRFQPARETTEKLQCVLDWAQELIIGGLVVEPLLSSVVHRVLQDGAVRAGDTLTPFVCHSVEVDKLRHRADVTALLDLVCGDAAFGDRNREVVAEWIRAWLPQSLSAAYAIAGEHRGAIEAIARSLQSLQRRLGDAGVPMDNRNVLLEEATVG